MGMRPMRNGYKILVRIPEGRRPPGRPMRRTKDNIRIDLIELNELCFWTLSIVWCLKNKQN
jgi:hypothetical protein